MQEVDEAPAVDGVEHIAVAGAAHVEREPEDFPDQDRPAQRVHLLEERREVRMVPDEMEKPEEIHGRRLTRLGVPPDWKRGKNFS